MKFIDICNKTERADCSICGKWSGWVNYEDPKTDAIKLSNWKKEQQKLHEIKRTEMLASLQLTPKE